MAGELGGEDAGDPDVVVKGGLLPLNLLRVLNVSVGEAAKIHISFKTVPSRRGLLIRITFFAASLTGIDKVYIDVS